MAPAVTLNFSVNAMLAPAAITLLLVQLEAPQVQPAGPVKVPGVRLAELVKLMVIGPEVGAFKGPSERVAVRVLLVSPCE